MSGVKMDQTDWLSDILHNVQLEQFYVPIRDQLQVTRLAHFDYVHSEDLEKIGISKPGIRRLLEAVKKKKLQQWRRNLWNKLLGSSSSAARDTLTTATHNKTVSGESGLTCLILEKNIILQEELGTGSFGVVKKGEWKSAGATSDGLPVAVKVLKADALSQPGVFDDFVHEVEAMHSLSHPNLIRLHGVVFHPLMMVCELATMGALLDYIRAQNGKVSLNLVWKWSEQVAAGMAYLERNRFLHRDLACRNILLSTLDMLKIGDFGLMRALPDSDDCYVMSERRRVPFPWCAPESLRSKQFSHASDVWMFAVALWEMYTFGEDPWMGLNGSDILRLILREGQRLTAPTACPPDVYMLMMQCWDLNPKERPTFAEIVKYLHMNKLESAVSSLSYRRQGQMSIDAGDNIILIDKRSELHWWKGQNQRTLEVGLFPCTLVNVLRNKNSLAPRKSQSVLPSRKDIAELSVGTQRGGESDDSNERSSVGVGRKKTAESRQAQSTRTFNTGNKHFNYSKLVNPRPADTPRPPVHTPVKEELLIDLDLPPSTVSGPAASSPSVNRSIMDEPIDVPQTQCKPEEEASIGGYVSKAASQQTSYSNLQAVPSLDSLAPLDSCSPRPPSAACDPFDTSHVWPASSARPNYDFTSDIKQPQSTQLHRQTPNYHFSDTIATPNNHQNLSQQLNNQRVNYQACPDTGREPYAGSRLDYQLTPLEGSQSMEQRIYGNLDRYASPHYAPNASNNLMHAAINSLFGTSQVNSTIQNDLNVPTQSEHIYTNNTLPLDRSCETNSIRLPEVSLDDKISESLNLKMNIYSNDAASRYASMTDQKRHSIAENSRSSGIYGNNSMSAYSNREASPQQSFVMETPDYYTKLSTPSPNCTQDYHKNIYVPTNEDTGKLKDFSGGIYNTKNYSSVNTKNPSSEYESYDYPYVSPHRTGEASTSQPVEYEPVYSEIAGSGEPTYNNVRLYDEVYEPSGRSRPHRPAPPAPSAPSPRPN